MCEECGASDNACETHFHKCLAKEFEDPGYGKVHHLTVSTYMIQHSSNLTREGWLYERSLLREFLAAKKPPEQIRKESKHLVDSSQRTFKIKSKTRQPVIPRTEWARTIMDVRLETREEYCDDVIAWARATLADAENIHI